LRIFFRMAPEIPFPLGLLHQRLDSGLVLCEALFHADFSRLAANRKHAIRAIRRNLEDNLPRLAPGDLYYRRLGTGSTARWVTLTLDPPRKQDAWRQPAQLRFPVVVWEHGREAALGRVPSLDIEVIAPDLDQLNRVLESEIIAALRRSGVTSSLAALAWTQRAIKFKVEWQTLPVQVPRLKHRAQREEDETGDEKPSILKQVATAMDADRQSAAIELDGLVEQIADALTAARPQSVLLVGPSGVGKTAAVRELVRTRADHRLGATPFFQTSGARIVAGQCGFGMWQERCTDLVREAAKKRAVLHLGNLVELMEVGKSEHNQTGLAGFLRPAIARGELLCIAECTPEQLPMIEREDPQLADAFRQLKVEEPDARRGRVILERSAADGRKDARPLTAPALDAIDRLHRRYATYSAYPGRPLRFLENLRRECDRTVPATPDDVLAAFTRETGLPRVLLDPNVRLDVSQTRDWFARRVIGQTEAVDLVVDLLATVKAGLTRPNRPIASLLFIGPTGVGKTEMAKALAEFLFGSKDRLTRFDMSEYADPLAVQRLAGGAFGGEGLLTAKVREQPFCVLLFDEFEKAHPAFFDMLLQALGEARLTDAGGRLADFRNAVVILTSNLGAESFQAGHPGFRVGGPDAAEARRHFVREVERFLRPEMFNRLDRLVPFAPLDAVTIHEIARREWNNVLCRDGIRFRGVQVTAADAVLPQLAEVGFDPKYGARPLKRAIERELLGPIAHQMNRYSAELALDVAVGVRDGKLSAVVKPRQEAGRAVSAVRLTGTEADGASECSRLRRLHQLLERSSAVRDLDNEVYQLEQAERQITVKQLKGKPLTNAEQMKLARLGRLREIAAEVRRQRQEANDLEEAAVVAFHTQAPADPDLAARQAKRVAEWDVLLFQLYKGGRPGPDRLTLGVFSEDKDRLFVQGKAYALIARARNSAVSAVQYLAATAADRPPGPPPPRPPEQPGEATRVWQKDYLLEIRKGEPLKVILKREPLDVPFARDDLYPATVGLGLHLVGPEVVLRFATEAGLHEFAVPSNKDGSSPDVLVETEAGKLEEYVPPERVERRGGIESQPPRRTYWAEKRTAVDRRHGVTVPWEGDLTKPLTELTGLNLKSELMRLVLE
jgi:ATP-dependent Clp protease ATP-binding subunit ClpA